ncbi:hypothetical protein BHE74_00035481 [Ensete ventricosum]|nr:hypothetical protein BHE74_00035481 [Ensete ventricosum]
MTMRMNIDCYRKIRRCKGGGVPKSCWRGHLIERKQCRVSVCGSFVPQDMAINIRRKTNRRVEIKELEVSHDDMVAAAQIPNPQ